MMRTTGIEINKPLLLAGEMWQPLFYPYTRDIGFYGLRLEHDWGSFAVSLSEGIKGKVYRGTAEWLKSQ